MSAYLQSVYVNFVCFEFGLKGKFRNIGLPKNNIGGNFNKV